MKGQPERPSGRPGSSAVAKKGMEGQGSPSTSKYANKVAARSGNAANKVRVDANKFKTMFKIAATAPGRVVVPPLNTKHLNQDVDEVGDDYNNY